MNTTKKFIINFSFLMIFFLSGTAFCQDKELKKIDDLIEKSRISHYESDPLKALEYAKQASKISLKIKNSEKTADSYIQMSVSLLTLQLYKQSLYYAQKASAEDFTKKKHDVPSAFVSDKIL